MNTADHTNRPVSIRGVHWLRRSGRLPAIDTQRCTGCGRCVGACEPHLLSLEPVRWQKFALLHESDRCTGCSACAVQCPFHAITMRNPATARVFNLRA